MHPHTSYPHITLTHFTHTHITPSHCTTSRLTPSYHTLTHEHFTHTFTSHPHTLTKLQIVPFYTAHITSHTRTPSCFTPHTLTPNPVLLYRTHHTSPPHTHTITGVACTSPAGEVKSHQLPDSCLPAGGH